jgi:hypothetical protein
MTPNYSAHYTETTKPMPANMQFHDAKESVRPSSLAAPSLVKPIPLSTRDLVKPVAMKVVRPIPHRINEQFYNEAFEEGLTMTETSAAAVLAHDWHRKWTQQDEQNHTMPDADFYDRTTNLPSHYDSEADRQGAMNPSLGSIGTPMDDDHNLKRSRAPIGVSPGYSGVQFDQVVFNPEDRLSASSWSSASSSLSSHMAPQVKRRFTGAVIEEDTPLQAPVAVRPMAVRPMAVRVSRPDLPTAHNFPHDGVPHGITTVRRQETLSPISSSGSSISSQSLMMTLLNRQNEVVHVVEDEEEQVCEPLPKPMTPMSDSMVSARDSVLHSLAITQGDVDSPKFKTSLDPLLNHFSQQDLDTRPHLTGVDSVDGMWLTLSKPSYFGCLGENDNGDPMYTLGRMTFDMFSPTNLVCSLQGNFNPVEVVSDEERKAMLETVPKSLREEVESGKTVLRTYHVVSAFTIEPAMASFPNAPNKDVHRPIKGIMTTYGYSLPDPDVENRHSIWFTGGRIEPNSKPADIFEWKRLFTLHPPKHTFGEKAKLLAVKLLMGATVPDKMAEDGSMEYTFTRPIGGHGMAYVDVVYLDETLRIVRGHRGTVFVFSRLRKN